MYCSARRQAPNFGGVFFYLEKTHPLHLLLLDRLCRGFSRHAFIAYDLNRQGRTRCSVPDCYMLPLYPISEPYPVPFVRRIESYSVLLLDQTLQRDHYKERCRKCPEDLNHDLR